jgi:hypothetical protein
MKTAAVILLIVGFLWGLLVVWMFLTIAGIADSPRSIAAVVFYWCGMLVGPFTLVTGAIFLLRGVLLRPGAILVAIGCVIFTGYALYNSVVGMQREPLQAPPPYLLYTVLLLIMLLSDAAAYKIYTSLTKERGPLRPPDDHGVTVGALRHQ